MADYEEVLSKEHNKFGFYSIGLSGLKMSKLDSNPKKRRIVHEN
jgi:hypothetical protein